MIRWRKGGAALLGLSLIAGCESAGLQRQYTALDSNGDRKRTVFFADTEAIYCVAEVSSGRADLTVEARVRAQQGADAAGALASNGVVATEEQAPGIGEGLVLAFAWERDEQVPYPAGEFVCELYLDGELEAEVPFRIELPVCPVVPVTPGGDCDGFVVPESECGDAQGRACRCGGGQWRC